MTGGQWREQVALRFAARLLHGDDIFSNTVASLPGVAVTVIGGQERAFTGLNQCVLLQVMKDQRWRDRRFFTLDQIEKSGWQVRDDAKPVSLQYLLADESLGTAASHGRAVGVRVFNASAVVGVDPLQGHAMTADRAHWEALKDGGPGQGEFVEALGAMADERAGDEDGLVSAIAATLLSARYGFEKVQPRAKQVERWSNQCASDPSSFIRAVEVGQKICFELSRAIGLAALQYTVGQGMIKVEHSAGAKRAYSFERIESMFTQAQAVLCVPFDEKDRAKALGAVWYPPQMVWFVPAGLDPKVFDEWALKTQSLQPGLTREKVLESFRVAMVDCGLDSSRDIETDGKWHSVPVTSVDKKNKAGSYIFSWKSENDGLATGMMINRHSGQRLPWRHEGAPLTPHERARARAVEAARNEQLQRAREALQRSAAHSAQLIWALGRDAQGHGYLNIKQIDALGLKQISGSVLLEYAEFRSEQGGSVIREGESYLLVPLVDRDNELASLQAISSDGSIKVFMRGAKKSGCMFVLGAESFQSVVADKSVRAISFVEGVATGKSLVAACSHPVVVCFDAGNLETVMLQSAEAIAPDVTMVAAVDNDQFHIERALEFVSARVGVMPFGEGGHAVRVTSGLGSLRDVYCGDVQVTGEWVNAPSGSYRFSLVTDEKTKAVHSAVVEVLEGSAADKRSVTFSNRGLRAGQVVIDALLQKDSARAVALAIPEFCRLVGRPTDWNDLMLAEGGGQVRNVLRKAGVDSVSRISSRGPSSLAGHDIDHSAVTGSPVERC